MTFARSSKAHEREGGEKKRGGNFMIEAEKRKIRAACRCHGFHCFKEFADTVNLPREVLICSSNTTFLTYRSDILCRKAQGFFCF